MRGIFKKTELAENGININFLNSFLTGLTAFVFCLILLISGSVNKKFSKVQEAIDKFIICENSSKAMKDSANMLTDEARFFIGTRDTKHAELYLKEITETKRKEKAMEDLKKVCSEKDLAYQRLKIAMHQSDSLNDMELYAMRLEYEVINMRNRKDGRPEIKMPERIARIEIKAIDRQLSALEMQQKATESLFGDGYLIYRTRVNENCDFTIASIEKRIEDELGVRSNELGKRLSQLQILFCLLFCVNILIFVVLAFLVLNPLKKFQASIQKDEKLKPVGSSEFRKLATAYNEIYDMKAKTERHLLIKAEYDTLTGILNRRAFDQICQTSAEKRQKIALLLVDLDNFKTINDTYGHSGGDTVLKELARIMVATFRKDDYVSRIGGDEFAVVLPDFKKDSTNRIIEKIQLVNDELSRMKDDIHPVSISVGVALSDNGYSQELFDKADKALYSVKSNGRKGCRIYDPKTM